MVRNKKTLWSGMWNRTFILWKLKLVSIFLIFGGFFTLTVILTLKTSFWIPGPRLLWTDDTKRLGEMLVTFFPNECVEHDGCCLVCFIMVGLQSSVDFLFTPINVCLILFPSSIFLIFVSHPLQMVSDKAFSWTIIKSTAASLSASDNFPSFFLNKLNRHYKACNSYF